MAQREGTGDGVAEGAAEGPRPRGKLRGHRVAITAERRSAELTGLLNGLGAETLVAPTLQWTVLADDEELRATTEEFIAAPPDILIITTDRGFTGWLDAAEVWGLGDALAEALRPVRIFTRGFKATGAVASAGLTAEWSPEEANAGALLDHLVDEVGVSGKRVVVQLNSDAELPGRADDRVERKSSLSALRRGLVEAGADLVPLGVYSWRFPDVGDTLNELVDSVCERRIDAVTFTSAASVVGLLRYADRQGLLEALLEGFDHRDSSGELVPGGVLAACVGPICARPFEDLGVAPVYPAKGRLGAIPRLVARELSGRVRKVRCAGHDLELRAGTISVDGDVLTPAPGPMALVRRLAANPGAVVSREVLLSELPRAGEDTHAVDVAITRLRKQLGHPEMIGTVFKRGYRLDIGEG